MSDVTRGTCRLTWKPPKCDGGERIKSYFIEKKTVEGKAWTKVQQSTQTLLNDNALCLSEASLCDLLLITVHHQVNPAYTSQSLVVPDLIGGEEYLFRVKAENRFGFGPYAETIEGAKAKDPIRKFVSYSPNPPPPEEKKRILDFISERIIICCCVLRSS